ncbi:hypothetical protein A4X03_0g9909, partial [Tilletia caries]
RQADAYVSDALDGTPSKFSSLASPLRPAEDTAKAQGEGEHDDDGEHDNDDEDESIMAEQQCPLIARDLLPKWFHVLELHALRFPELRIPFPWNDAFIKKPIFQFSIAYDKASGIFNIVSTLSSYVASQGRHAGNPDGLNHERPQTLSIPTPTRSSPPSPTPRPLLSSIHRQGLLQAQPILLIPGTPSPDAFTQHLLNKHASCPTFYNPSPPFPPVWIYTPITDIPTALPIAHRRTRRERTEL